MKTYIIHYNLRKIHTPEDHDPEEWLEQQKAFAKRDIKKILLDIESILTKNNDYQETVIDTDLKNKELYEHIIKTIKIEWQYLGYPFEIKIFRIIEI